MTSFNPVLTIGHQLAEALQIHKGMPEQALDARRRDARHGGHPEGRDRLTITRTSSPAACASAS